MIGACSLDINQLHENARNGDSNAEKKLFELLTVRFRYLATLRLKDETEAEEVTQEALLAISGEFREIVIERSFAAWAHKVFENRIRNYTRSRQKRGRLISSELNNEGLSGRDDHLKRRLLGCLRRLNDLNTRYARILNLHYHGYTTDEICEKLDIKPGNLYVILSRARSLLQECMNKGDLI